MIYRTSIYIRLITLKSRPRYRITTAALRRYRSSITACTLIPYKFTLFYFNHRTVYCRYCSSIRFAYIRLKYASLYLYLRIPIYTYTSTCIITYLAVCYIYFTVITHPYLRVALVACYLYAFYQDILRRLQIQNAPDVTFALRKRKTFQLCIHYAVRSKYPVLSSSAYYRFASVHALFQTLLCTGKSSVYVHSL